MLFKKVRGRRRGTPPPPIRPGPVGGHGEGRGPVVTLWSSQLFDQRGRAVKPVPRVRSADGGDDCRRNAPNLGSPRAYSRRARHSTASKRDREEPGVLARLHAQQYRPLAARARIGESLAHLIRARDALARDIEDDVTGAETLLGS